MAQNTRDEYRKFRYYEGICSSGDFIKEIANVLSLGVRTNPIKDADGHVVSEPTVLKAKNWDIVYPTPSKSFIDKINTNKSDNNDELHPERRSQQTEDDNEARYNNEIKEIVGRGMYIDKIHDQVSQITDTVILRTTTSPIDSENVEEDDLSVSEDTHKKQTTMYVQFYKPKYLANPEEYPLDAELQGLTPQLITKEMWQEARKSSASVVHDIALLKDVKLKTSDQVSSTVVEKVLVTSKRQPEPVDSVSEAYYREALFDDKTGAFAYIASAIGEPMSTIVTEPTANNKITTFDLNKAQLNSIKNNSLDAYNFIKSICGRTTSFTDEDYSLIDNVNGQITLITSGNGGSDNTTDSYRYIVTLTYTKTVEIFTIAPGILDVTMIDNWGGHEALDNLRPELYSEGRYVPLPDEYLGELQTNEIIFDKPVRFCLDKIHSQNTGNNNDNNTEDKIFHGTVVLRYSYDKKFNYTGLESLKPMMTDSVALPNNHYCLVRMFDYPADDWSGPKANIIDSEGNITVQNSHASPWSKLSWYKDFEEVMMDDIDEDVSTNSVTDGTILVPLETAGLTADTRISYWINCNNDRFSMVVMGNPALDYEEDRHLISSCYVGRIDSFEGSVDDVVGNFALYTSSSTTPCKTEMVANDTQYHLDTINYTNEDITKAMQAYKANPDDETNLLHMYLKYSEEMGGKSDYSKVVKNGLSVYYITLTGNKFFNENEQPRYLILNTEDNTLVPLGQEDGKNIYFKRAAYRQFIYGSSDTRSSQIAIYIDQSNLQGTDNDRKKYKIYFSFGYYEEKFTITSGITRDIFGNVIDIKTEDSYGKNTSDGVTSISMYHTRSKAFYQKHQMLFATTEEYMSKVMYGKSSYTGEYYADRIKVTHGNDGPRGILSDTLVIDSSSLYPKDELVINKDFERNPNEMEETFAYFPITAPFSPLSDSPNARYGIALKKSEREPEYTDNKKILNIARNELDTIMNNITSIEDETVIPDQTDKGCKIYWEVKKNSNWYEDNYSPDAEEFVNVDPITGAKSKYSGVKIDADNVYITVDNERKVAGTNIISLQKSELAKGSAITKKFKSLVQLSKFLATNQTTKIYYGFSDHPLTGIAEKTNAIYTVDDGTKFNNIHTYTYNDNLGIVDLAHPLTEIIPDNKTDSIASEIAIYNAEPTKYLNIFCITDGDDVVGKIVNEENSTETDVHNEVICAYTSILLNNEKKDDKAKTITTPLYDLLQYPCTVLAYATKVKNSAEQGILERNVIYNSYSYNYCDYGKPLSINLSSIADGTATILKAHYVDYPTTGMTIQEHINSGIVINTLDDDLYVNISFGK